MLMSSTLHGKLASDGLEGAHSPFARALIEWLEKAPGLRLHELLQLNVAKTVMESTSRGGIRPQIPETVVRGTPPHACLKGTQCEGDPNAVELALEVEALKRDLAHAVELGEGSRIYLAELEKKYGRALTDDERRQALGEYRDVAREMAARHDTRGDEALRQLKAGNTAEAEKLLEEQLAARKREATERAAASHREAAKSARQLAALTKPKDIAKAAAYYKDAVELDPTDVQTWLDYGSAALDAGRSGEARTAFEQAALKARQGNDTQKRFWATLRLGEVEQSGSVASAEQHYAVARSIAEEAIKTDPDNMEWQRSFWGWHIRVGRLLFDKGDLPGALSGYQAALTIAERLAKADADNSDLQWNLAVSHAQVGSMLHTQGHLATSLESYQASLAITERLSKADPSNTAAQQSYSVTQFAVGSILIAQRNPAAGLERYRAALSIAERLAKDDPSNFGLQSNLASFHAQIGDVLSLQGDLDGAMESYMAALDVGEPLAKADPANSRYQGNLATTHRSVAEVSQALGVPKVALVALRNALTILEHLANLDPNNAISLANLGLTH